MKKNLFKFVFLSGIIILLTLKSVCYGQNVKNTQKITAKPVMDILHLFTSKDVPDLGSSETKEEPFKPEVFSVPENLPGNGLAQHPMLYFGECYNILFLINKG